MNRADALVSPGTATNGGRTAPTEPPHERRAPEPEMGEAEHVHRFLCELAAEVECEAIHDARRKGGEGDQSITIEFVHNGFHYILAREPVARRLHSVALSSREREIARMIAAGHTNKTVAHVLEISSWTVSTHLRRIFAKLDVNSRAQMVAQLLEHGLLVEPVSSKGGPLPSTSRRG